MWPIDELGKGSYNNTRDWFNYTGWDDIPASAAAI